MLARKLDSLLAGKQNSTATLEDNFGNYVQNKICSYHTIHRSCSLVFTKGVENLPLHKNQPLSIYSSFIHNCQNLEATKMSSASECINKLWYIQTRGFFSTKKK
ncbi:unnamed protein product [Rangifer tarandus platyrhynchus]|uniref:Uncharacterized protein n=1 Tax=Rangifer tarandus platyrhynchus TaxID=3082113 RepID=A0AC59ZQM6_RANTA